MAKHNLTHASVSEEKALENGVMVPFELGDCEYRHDELVDGLFQTDKEIKKRKIQKKRLIDLIEDLEPQEEIKWGSGVGAEIIDSD